MNIKCFVISSNFLARFNKPHSSILTTLPEELFIKSLYLSFISSVLFALILLSYNSIFVKTHCIYCLIALLVHI